MTTSSAAFPFIVKDCGLNVVEFINVDPVIDGSHKAIGALNILSRKFKGIVFTLPQECSLTADVEPQLKQISEKTSLRLVFQNTSQVPFAIDFTEAFCHTEDAVASIKSSLVIARVIKDFADVTPFRTSALNILDLLKQPDISFDKIQKGIIDEPLLVARILQVANSAFYMRRNPVDNIENALAYLGLEGIRQVLVQLIFQSLATKYFAHQKDKLVHGECCAHLAVKLAERKTKDLMTLGKIRVAGLLHDVGALALQFCYQDEYTRTMNEALTQKTSIIEVERSIFGTDHCQVGARLSSEWKLPDYVKTCASDHHSIASSQFDKIVRPVICANAFLNTAIDKLPGLDFSPLAREFSITPNISDNEARMELLAFFTETMKSFTPEQG
ncbi:MAG: HDOD domain-containing protein [Candidatus Riflebacteria bacterium]|nr:HDOD domain-containing protein [Candidatus Riflebacteria bacterium]